MKGGELGQGTSQRKEGAHLSFSRSKKMVARREVVHVLEKKRRTSFTVLEEGGETKRGGAD